MAYTTIDDPSAYFQTTLYTGNGTSTNAITNDGNSDLQPDWLWLKARSITADHIIFDSTRGTNKRISTNTTGAEETQAFYSSFDTDGFTLGDSNANVNQSGATYVNWQWKANGGTTSSNTDGSITSTVQASTTAGFSIVTYTGNATAGATVGHGLGATPKMVFYKSRSASGTWHVYNEDIGAGNVLYLNTTNASGADANFLNSTAPSSTLLTLGSSSGANGSGTTYVAYCFAEKQGYSKFGSFTGNGNVDGPFIYTGFKPAFGIFKRTDTTGNWYMMTGKIGDDGQDGNPLEDRLEANTNAAEADMGQGYDFLSNGVKVRHNGAEINGSGNSFIYMIWAEHPFVSSDGVPTTAR